jgi:NADH:ubiquinone oxidoreductase subunit 6 (subunit J)
LTALYSDIGIFAHLDLLNERLHMNTDITFTGSQVLHYYFHIGVVVAVVVGIVQIRDRESLPERLLNLALLVVLWPLALVALLGVLACYLIYL